MYSILNETVNFFRLYRHICGESEVPEIYNFWAAVSLIAATVEDRVWYQKFKHEALFPNLYVIFVGPSGLGKGTAISNAVRLVECSIMVNKYRGKVTSAHLIDHLGKPKQDEWGNKYYANPKLWLIMDELQNDVSSNPKLVEEFVYLMTELYTASNYKIQTGTRSTGEVSIDRPILNWLAGVTEDDLREILSARLIKNGFAARLCCVFGEYDFEKRLPRIKYPSDYEEVFKHLCLRLWMLQRTQGQIVMTPTAEAEVDKWYMKRPAPEEELLYSSWKRHHDLLLKFAMILALADGGPLVVQHVHIIQAKQMVGKIYAFSEMLAQVGSETWDTKTINDVRRYLMRRGEAKLLTISRYFKQMRGVGSKSVRYALLDLEGDGLLIREVDKMGDIWYKWKK